VKTCKQVSKNPKVECGSEVYAEELKKKLAANLIYVENYFDINEFENSPMKSVLKFYFRPMNRFFKLGELFGLKKFNI